MVIMEEKEKDEAMNALLDLVKDIHCFDKLETWIQGNNIFDILKISRAEIRHSNMLAWLLDPNESHGVGNAFLYSFLAILADDSNIDNSIILKLLVSDLKLAQVYREWNHIDVLITFPNKETLIAIENKIGSHEHNANGSGDSQLQKYKKVLNDNDKFKEYEKVLVYLTPDGEEPSVDSWSILTYTELINQISSVFASKKESLGLVERVIIENYIDTIKKEVIMDEELVALCNEIYQTHKKAFDLIFENRNDNTKLVSDTCKQKLLAYERGDNELGIAFDESSSTKSYLKFRTNKLKESFKELDPKCYYYQIEIRPSNGDATVVMKLVLHQEKGNMLESNWINKMNGWIAKNKQLKENENWEWKTAWANKRHTFSDVNDTDIEKWFKNCLKEVSDNENKIK